MTEIFNCKLLMGRITEPTNRVTANKLIEECICQINEIFEREL